MKKEDILNAPYADFTEEVPLLDFFYVIPTRRKHDSGYIIMEIVGVNHKLNYIKKLDCCDVVSQDLYMQFNKNYSYSFDIEPQNGFIRVFSYGMIKVNFRVSSFTFEIVKKED